MYKNEYYDDIYETLKTDKRVLICGIAGIGKTAFSLKLAVDKYIANTYIDCETDYDYLIGLAENVNDNDKLAEYIETTFGVAKHFHDELVFIFDNIDVTDFYYKKLYDGLADKNYKQILIATAMNPHILEIKKQVKAFTFRPINFDDYLYYEESELSIDLLTHFTKGIEKLPILLHDGIYRSFVDFYYIGGMPVPRNTYFSYDYGDVLVTSSIKTSHEHVINTLYKRSHASEKMKYQCNQILSSLVAQMAKPDYLKFVIADIREGATYKEFEEAFNFLEINGIIHRVYNIENPSIFCCFLYDFSVLRELINEYNFNHGCVIGRDDIEKVIIRNYLVQYFKKYNYKINFWRSRYKSYVDVVVTFNNKKIAINVENDESHKNKSLSEFCKTYPESVLVELSGENLKKENNKWRIPFYAISSIMKMDI